MRKEFRLRFPPFFYEEIKIIISLVDKDKDIFYNVLKETSIDAKLEDITEILKKDMELSGSTIIGILSFILSTFNIYIYSGQDLSSFIKEIEKELEFIKDELELEGIEDWTETLQFFEKIFGLENNIGIIAKSKGIGLEYPKSYYSSRILTDLRPVFPINLAQEFNTGIITHTLKIEYYKEGTKKEFFVRLDNSDLDDLSIQIKRATEKVENINKVARDKNIYLIGDDL